MKRKSKPSVPKSRFITLRSFLIFYSFIVSTLALSMLLLFIPTYQTQQNLIADTDFRGMVRDMQLAMYDRPDATADRLYFHDMKLSIPVSADTKQLLYEYQEAISEPDFSMPASASFASKPALYNTSKSTDQIPCARLADVVFNEKQSDRGGHDFPLAGEVKLEDGRTMYIYQNSGKCMNIWNSLTSQKLVDLLKQAKSN